MNIFSSFRDSTYEGDGLSDAANGGHIEQIFDGINRDILSLTAAGGGHLAESDGDNGDVELDDEDSVGDDRFHSSSGNLSSFKAGAGRGPALPVDRRGGRSRSRGGEAGERVRKVKSEKEKRVGQLDERNLKKAANRYGTLPKGARIGAYLESMRVSGLTPEPMSDDTDTLDSTKSGATDPGHRSVVSESLNPAMARSNSSHGGFSAAARHQQPRRLQTYTAASPAPPPRQAPANNALHDLDFPPPPPSSDMTHQVRQSRDQSSDSGSVRSVSDVTSQRLNCVSPMTTPASHHQQKLVQEMVRSETPPLPASSPLPPPASSSGDPASQLVTELFESIKLKSDEDRTHASNKPPPAAKETKSKPTVTDFKAGLRKVNQHPLSQDKSQDPVSSQINFKSQLKKTNSSLYAQPSSGQQDDPCDTPEPGKVDFKAQLKKVKNSKQANSSNDNTTAASDSQDLNNVKASLRSVSKHNIDQEQQESEEEKRRSTGSISSLKKMWEEGGEGDDRPGSVVKFEKRVWPPVPSTETEKPMVPVKPTVKPPPTSKPPPPREPSCKPPPKPSPATKPMVCNIYAAPSSVPPRPSISSTKPKLQDKSKTAGDARADSTDSGLSSSNDKDAVLDLSVSLENILETLAREGAITKTSAMTASEKVIREWCGCVIISKFSKVIKQPSLTIINIILTRCSN